VCRRAAPGNQHGAFSLGRNARDAATRGVSISRRNAREQLEGGWMCLCDGRRRARMKYYNVHAGRRAIFA
jgi:hypothetical protein